MADLGCSADMFVTPRPCETLLVTIDKTLQEQLDDVEFDLPKVAEPSLDSILNESQNGDVDPFTDDNEFAGLLGTTDTISLNSFDDPEKKRKRKIYEGHGSVMRHRILEGVSSQMVSANTRVNCGLPTAMCVDLLIAIGTAHGIVYIFELNQSQTMKWSLGPAEAAGSFGSVSSLCFNADCTRLLAGFAKGQITMWDVTKGKLLRTITDAHPAGQAVLHLKFTDSLTLALFSDSGGSVYELEFTRNVSGRGSLSRCLFSGSRGEVCTVEPLHVPAALKNHPTHQHGLVAMVSFTKLMVLTLKTEMKVVFSFPVQGAPDTLPLVSWQFAGINVPVKGHIVDPVLAVARHSTFHFFQSIVTSSTESGIQLQRLQTSEVPYKIMAFCWMNSATIVIMDTVEKIHVVDVRSWEELEMIDMSDMLFVYSTSAFKGFANGCNVSPALSLAGDHACYYSMMASRKQLFVLGQRSVHILIIRTWEERLQALLRDNHHQEALALALSFYDGTAKAVIGLPRDKEQKQQIVTDKILEMLYTYVDLSMTKLCPEFGRIDELIKHYENVVPVCVEYCLRLNRVDALFGRLYERFGQDVIAHGAFLECLEPYILDDQLKTMSPQIIKDLTTHFQTKGMLTRVEACIVHLDIISLDVHETIKLCWKTGMYDALIFIYNHGLHDYLTPIQELTALLRKALLSGKQLSDDQVRLGNRLLVYISNSLAGLAYPIGDLSPDLGRHVKSVMFQTLTCLHSTNSAPDEKLYPYLRTFLEFDTREFLNVLALAFEEEEFGKSDGYQQRQKVVDILLHIMVEGSGFSPSQIGILFTFLARQLARHSTSIQLNRPLFDQVLEYLCKPGDTAHKEERQEALLELLGVDDVLQIDKVTLLAMAEHANLYRVSEFIYKKQHLYDKMLLCYIKDSLRCHLSFSFIESTLRDNPTPEVVASIREVTLQNLVTLVESSCEQTARLLLDVIKEDVMSVVKRLEDSPATLYGLLQELIAYRESMETLPALEAAVYEMYLQLMCVSDSRNVENFLKTSTGYRAKQAYQICEKYRLYSALSYLLEKMGNIQNAFDMLMKTFHEKLDIFVEMVLDAQASKHTNNVTIISQQLEAALLKLIGLCQRNSAKLSEDEREMLWFPLLDALIEPQQKLPANNSYVYVLKDASKQVMNCMMGYVALPALMSKIIKEFTFSQGKFGDVKDLVLGMLHTYNYEKTLLNTCCMMLNTDLVMHMRERKRESSKGFVPAHDRCGYCNKRASASQDTCTLVVFNCGHLFHETCLERSGVHRDVAGAQWGCYLCDQLQHGSTRPTALKKESNKLNLTTSAEDVHLGSSPAIITSPRKRCIQNATSSHTVLYNNILLDDT